VTLNTPQLEVIYYVYAIAHHDQSVTKSE